VEGVVENAVNKTRWWVVTYAVAGALGAVVVGAVFRWL
jgi:hypothetical protein